MHGVDACRLRGGACAEMRGALRYRCSPPHACSAAQRGAVRLTVILPGSCSTTHSSPGDISSLGLKALRSTTMYWLLYVPAGLGGEGGGHEGREAVKFQNGSCVQQ